MYKTRKNLIKLIIVSLLVLNFSLLISQEIGMKKSLTDGKSGQTFNNFRSDSTEVVFYQVLKPEEFLYDQPKNNADAVYTLDSDTFIESVQESGGGNFIKVRVLDKFHGIIEGWIRFASLKSMKYYGRSFTERNSVKKSEDIDKKVNPNWIKDNNQIVYLDSSLTGDAAGKLNKGDIVFLEKQNVDSICSIFFTNREGIFLRGFIKRGSLSELALLDDSTNDFDSLYKKYDPVLLRNDVDKACFISYSGIEFINKDVKEFTEDKVCKEISTDTLSYRYSISSNINDIKKKIDVKNKFERSKIAMYRFLPDENIVTRLDTLKCKVLEFVNVPKSAKIIIGDTEESTIINRTTKLFITHLNNFDMDIVFQRESTEYTWMYTKNISTGKIIKSKTDTEKIIKRMIAFRKH